MKKKTIRKTFLVSIVLVVIYIIASTVLGFLKVKPFIENIFDRGENLENNQKLIDSILFYSTVKGDDKKVNLQKDDITIHFFDVDCILCKREIEALNNYNSQKLKLLVVSLNEKEEVELFLAENNIQFSIFLTDTTKIPLLYTQLIYPYTLEIQNGKISKSYIGKLKL